jgi:gamma-glutamylcyclotransferase (GGCT)/AIG2-like uncharacterized protein YtfP
MLIFVYGTLRRGQSNHCQLGPSRFVSYASTAPRYELVDLGGYPALLEGGRDVVRGELFEVPDSWLSHLDAFEDVPTLYERVPVQLAHAQVLGYVMRREVAGDAPRIASGDWCAQPAADGYAAALSGEL